MFNLSQVIVRTNKQTLTDSLTNKQTPLKTYTSLRYATPVGKYSKYQYGMFTANPGSPGKRVVARKGKRPLSLTV